MSKFYFPSKEEIYNWGNALKERTELSPFMPEVSDFWAGEMRSSFEVVQLYCNHNETSLEYAASRIFYKIIKNHRMIDGNKRSAVICLYFFFYLNGSSLEVPIDDLYRLTPHIANSSPTQKEAIIHTLNELFQELTSKLSTEK